MATGRKMQLGFEVYGAKGSLVFTQERFNELLFYRAGGNPREPAASPGSRSARSIRPTGSSALPAGTSWASTISRPSRWPSSSAPSAGGPRSGPDFREACEIQKVVETAVNAGRARQWLKIP